MQNIPKMKVGIVAVSRDCFPESLSVNRRKALVAAYEKKYGKENIYECPVCIVESEIHMRQALADIQKAGCNALGHSEGRLQRAGCVSGQLRPRNIGNDARQRVFRRR